MTPETFGFFFQVGNTILLLVIFVLIFKYLWEVGMCVYELIKNCNCLSADRQIFINIMKRLIKYSLISLFFIAIVVSVFYSGLIN